MTRTAVAPDDGDEPTPAPVTHIHTTSSSSWTAGAVTPTNFTVTIPTSTVTESDIRHSISEKLIECIKTYSKVGYPETFVQGMERALEIINSSQVPRGQTRLF
jgi:hypothetical protein